MTTGRDYLREILACRWHSSSLAEAITAGSRCSVTTEWMNSENELPKICDGRNCYFCSISLFLCQHPPKFQHSQFLRTETYKILSVPKIPCTDTITALLDWVISYVTRDGFTELLLIIANQAIANFVQKRTYAISFFFKPSDHNKKNTLFHWIPYLITEMEVFEGRSQNCEKWLLASSCLSVWNNSAPTGRIFMKFYIWVFLENLSRKFKFR